MKKNSILIIEDEADLLSIYEQLASEEFHPIYLAANLREARKIMKSQKVDAILMDNILPDGKGIDFHEELAHIQTIPSLAITSFFNNDFFHKCIENSVSLFVEKPFSINTVREKLKELKNLSNSKREEQEVLDFHQISSPALEYICREYKLTSRETEILQKSLLPLEAKDISNILNISVHTVKRHWDNIHKKLGVHSRIELQNFIFTKNRKVRARAFHGL